MITVWIYVCCPSRYSCFTCVARAALPSPKGLTLSLCDPTGTCRIAGGWILGGWILLILYRVGAVNTPIRSLIRSSGICMYIVIYQHYNIVIFLPARAVTDTATSAGRITAITAN